MADQRLPGEVGNLSVETMTGASGAASRTAAQRKADALVARRAARFAQRERGLRDLIADYHHAADQAAKVRSAAEARAARILADAEARAADVRDRAEKDAAGFEQTAHAAVRAMVEFGESRDAIAELTGLSAAQVRQLHRAPNQFQGGRSGT